MSVPQQNSPTLQQAPKRLFLALISPEPEQKIFLHISGRTYKEIRLDDLTESVSLQYDDGKPVPVRLLIHAELGTIISARKEPEYREALKDKICVQDGPLMKPCEVYQQDMVVYSECKSGEEFRVVVSEDYNIMNYNGGSGILPYQVVDGQLKYVTKVDTYTTFTYNREKHYWAKDIPDDWYSTKSEAKFFNATTIEGSEKPTKSWADVICLDEEQKKKVNNLMLEFKQKLEDIGVNMFYHQDKGKMMFLRNSNCLPEDFHFHSDSVSYEDIFDEDNFPIPPQAFYFTPAQIPFDYFNCDYTLWCSKNEE